jgi:hypothetical protein
VDDARTQRHGYAQGGAIQRSYALDTLAILLSYLAFGLKLVRTDRFSDGPPREMNNLYPQESLKSVYVNIAGRSFKDQTSSAWRDRFEEWIIMERIKVGRSSSLGSIEKIVLSAILS